MANIINTLGRGNSFGLRSSYAAVQNATTDGRTRGFEETTRVNVFQLVSNVVSTNKAVTK
jgi:hypothetical protein